MRNRTKEMLKAGQTTIGAWVNFGTPDSAEIMAHMGLDWLVFDTEHGPWSIETVLPQIQAISATDVTPIVRVGWNDMVMVKRALDIGALGVIVPWVNNKEEALRAVQAAKYPPEGNRGCGPRRASMFGLDRDYIPKANDLTMVIVQIETLTAVDNLEEILAVPGIDAVFVGPEDLAASQGLLGKKSDPANLAAIERILQKGKEKRVPVGIYGMGPETMKDHIDRGFKFVTIGSDMSFLQLGLREVLRRIGRS